MLHMFDQHLVVGHLATRGRIPQAIAWLCLVAWFDIVTTCALVLGSVRNRKLGL
jgi:hypothetical protein